MIHGELLDILVCPACKNPVEMKDKDGRVLVCSRCRRHYPVEAGIPVMIPREENRMDPGV